MPRRAFAAAVGCAAAWAIAPTAGAQTPAATPQVEGEVSGVLAPGGALTMRVEALMPGGWEGLHLVEVVVIVEGREVDHLRYDIEDTRLALGDQEMVVGTGDAVVGELVRLAGSRVVVTTGAGHLSFTATAQVLREIPDDARFRLSVTGDRGERASVTRRLTTQEPEGLTWTTVVAAVIAALLAGGFVGNLYASRRRPSPRLSVYGAIRRRLDEERSSSAEARR